MPGAWKKVGQYLGLVEDDELDQLEDSMPEQSSIHAESLHSLERSHTIEPVFGGVSRKNANGSVLSTS